MTCRLASNEADSVVNALESAPLPDAIEVFLQILALGRFPCTSAICSCEFSQLLTIPVSIFASLIWCRCPRRTGVKRVKMARVRFLYPSG